MKKHVSHGEVNFFETSVIPEGAKKINIKEDFYVVGESETHGNDHRVSVCDKENVEIYEKDGKLYLKNNVQTDVYCPNEGRHDRVVLEPSIWEIDSSKEYDYISQEQRNVAD
jgi:hypothetical protein